MNNLVEQDDGRVKQRVYAMLGFKRFENAGIRISGVEVAHKIKKGQFDTSKFSFNKPIVTKVSEAEVWDLVLAA